MTTAGNYSSRIDLETNTVTNTNGVPVDSWGSTETAIPAWIVARSSMTYTQAAAVNAKTTHLVTVAYRSNITSLSRFKIGSRVFHVNGPAMRVPEDRPTETVFEVTEVE